MHTRKTGNKEHRRGIWSKALAGVGVLVVVWGLAVTLWYTHPSTKASNVKMPQQAMSIPNRASPEYDYSLTQYSSTIKSGQTYISDTVHTVTPNLRLILDYLQRKYGLNKNLSAQYNPITPPVPGQQEDPIQFTAFKRIAYPDDLVPVLPSADGDPMTQMMIAAMQCDRIPLNADFSKLVQSNIEAGDYRLTHVAFSLQRMKENGCSYFSNEKLSVLDKNVAERMAQIVISPNITQDLRYEAVAFLLDLGRTDLVQAAWITKIVAEQQPNGGWKADSKASETDNHATILALWSLLQYVNTNAPKEPMIRRPTK